MRCWSLLVAGTLVCASAVAATGTSTRDMVAIPAGPFTMGSDDGPPDERPAHQVELAAYAIDHLPVTNAQFAEFLNAMGTHNKQGERLYDFDDSDARIHQRGAQWTADAGYDYHPAVEPTWAGARDYCAWRGLRLPTEAEWEKAARGTDRRKYPWGDAAPDRTRAQFGARGSGRVCGERGAGGCAEGAEELVDLFSERAFGRAACRPKHADHRGRRADVAEGIDATLERKLVGNAGAREAVGGAAQRNVGIEGAVGGFDAGATQRRAEADGVGVAVGS